MSGVVPEPEAQDAEPVAPRFDDAYPPLAYHRLHLAGDRGWWRPLVGIVGGGLVAFLVMPLVLLLLYGLLWALTGDSVGDRLDALVDLDSMSPMLLSYLLLSIALTMPVAWALTRWLHGLRPRWMTSIAPRMRWGYFAVCCGAAVVALIATMVASIAISAIDPSAMPGEGDLGDWAGWSSTVRDYLLVIVLIVPFQAAAEEYVFRGYLTQACGGVFADERVARVVAVLVPALIFALAHGSQSPPVFFDRFAFGVVAGVLVVVTGGLEAAIAMHVLNNLLAFGLALVTGTMDQVLTPSGGSWLSIPVTLVQSITFVALAVLAHRRMGLADRADSAVLIASRGRVYGSFSAPQGA